MNGDASQTGGYVSLTADRPNRAETEGLIVGHSDEPASYLVSRSNGARSWLLMITESGGGTVHQAESTIALRRGSAALLAPDVAQTYGTAQRPLQDPVLLAGTGSSHPSWRFWWVHFHMRASWLQVFDLDQALAGHHFDNLDEAVVVDALELFARLHAAARWPGYGPLPQPIRDQVLRPLASVGVGWSMAAPLVESLLLLLSGDRGLPPAGPFDERVERVLAAVAADPAAPHSMTSLARLVALSPSRLAHLCTAVIGRPLMQQVRGIRLAHAARLLQQTTLSVAQVAHASGFASPFHFSRSFTAAYGTSPTWYRSSRG